MRMRAVQEVRQGNQERRLLGLREGGGWLLVQVSRRQQE
jgi:hypothetical protein